MRRLPRKANASGRIVPRWRSCRGVYRESCRTTSRQRVSKPAAARGNPKRDERKTGTIKYCAPARGFGFLTTDDHREAFFHISEWSEDDDPCKGERVSFVEDAGHGRGPCAREVR